MGGIVKPIGKAWLRTIPKFFSVFPNFVDFGPKNGSLLLLLLLVNDLPFTALLLLMFLLMGCEGAVDVVGVFAEDIDRDRFESFGS
jgi:hypothetical protein